jgi:hypothetical protein
MTAPSDRRLSRTFLFDVRIVDNMLRSIPSAVRAIRSSRGESSSAPRAFKRSNYVEKCVQAIEGTFGDNGRRVAVAGTDVDCWIDRPAAARPLGVSGALYRREACRRWIPSRLDRSGGH